MKNRAGFQTAPGFWRWLYFTLFGCEHKHRAVSWGGWQYCPDCGKEWS